MTNSAFPHPTKVPTDGEAWMWYVIWWGLAAALFAGAMLGALATYVVHSLTQKDPSATTTGIAGVAGAGIYYAFQGRFTWRAWFTSYKTKTGNTSQRGRQNATTGGVNVALKGKGQNVTINQAAPAAPNVVVVHAGPVVPAPEAHLVQLREKTPVGESTPAILVDERVEVAGRGVESLTISVVRGEIVEGSIVSDQPLSVFLMDERKFLAWRNGEEMLFRATWLDDQNASAVKWKAPKTGYFRVVVDNSRKANSRTVKISLRKQPVPPKLTSQAP